MPQQDVARESFGPRSLSSNADSVLWLDRSGALVVIDFYAKAIIDGHGFQVRAGTISVPLVGDVVITDSAAEFCVDVTTGFVLIPVYQKLSVNLGTGTLHEYQTKSVATASTSGAAFTMLPLSSGGAAAGTYGLSARVAAAGGVAVTAELNTTTLLHWSAGTPIAFGAQSDTFEWEPLRPPRLNGIRSLYTQIAADGTGPSYFANLDVVGFTAAQLSA